MEPLVSIILPTFNRASTLREAIESVLAQSYKSWELIVVDNHSIDSTDEILKNVERPQIKVLKIHNQGNISASRNQGILSSVGELIAFLDSDDWWESDKLERQVPLFEKPKVGLAYGNWWDFDERSGKTTLAIKKTMPSGKVLNELLADNFVGLLTVVVRRQALEAFKYPCDLRYPYIGDFDMYVRVAEGWHFAYQEEPLGTYRRHRFNESIKFKKRQLPEWDEWLAETQRNPALKSLPGLKKRIKIINYLRALDAIRNTDTRLTLRFLLTKPIGIGRWKILLLFLVPRWALKAFTHI